MIKKRVQVDHKAIAWDTSVPDEIQETVSPLLEEYWHLLPGWVNELVIGYNGDEAENVASTSGMYDYRFGRIDFTQAWLEVSEKARREIVVHEFVHLMLVPYQDQVQSYRSLMEKQGGCDKSLVEHFDNRMQGSVEASTEDIAQAILRNAQHVTDKLTGELRCRIA